MNIFHPLINEWFANTYQSPTDIQLRAWPEIARGKNVLVTAPTGCGKTLTAFLWAIDRCSTGTYEPGRLSVVYISPLKALNNDIRKNLLTPLNALERFFIERSTTFRKPGIMTRSGDTPEDERRTIRKNPPDILITTPESLFIMLTSKNTRGIFRNIRSVIIDEIHAIADEKRGTFLMTSIERLTLLSGEFQRIALSATVRPPETIADFIGGYTVTEGSPESVYRKRAVVVVESSIRKSYAISVRYPAFVLDEFDNEPVWMHCADEFRKIIHCYRSTLIFANSKRSVEKLTRLINEPEPVPIAYSHHGALSRELRLAVEQRLKEGTLKSIVATNSLELGIDIGHLDRVILVQTPFRISSAIQRIGRAGHTVGETCTADIYPLFGKDFIYAAVTAKCITDFAIEAIHPVENPLDVLAQVILSMTSTDTWNIDALYAFIRTIHSFRNLPKKQFDLVVDMLSGNYADSRIRELSPRMYVDTLAGTATAKEGTAYLLYLSGGTIPDRGVFNIRLQENGARIGELDEEFVWERRLGDAFPFGNSVWRIRQITPSDVIVVPETRAINILPFWKAEEQNRDFHYSEKIGRFLETIETLPDDISRRTLLEKEYYLTAQAAEILVGFLERERRSLGTVLPHRHHVVIEHYDDPENMNGQKQVIIHTFWGGKVNRPFTIALSAWWEDRFGYPLQYYTDNDCILLSLPHDFSESDIFSFITYGNIESLLRKKLESTGWFGARFRENAGRALLLPKQHFNKRVPLWLNRLRSKKLLDAVAAYRDFPLFLETWRTCLQDDFDLVNLRLIIDEILEGQIKISSATTVKPSPFCDNVIWRQTNKNVYEDDTPLSGKSFLRDDLLREIALSPHLRPAIPIAVIEMLDGKIKRTAPGYAPDSLNDLLAWIDERTAIPLAEWELLAASVRHEIPDEWETVIEKIAARVVVITINHGAVDFMVAIENLPFIANVFRFDYARHSCRDLFGRELPPDEVIALIASIKYKRESDDDRDGVFDFFSNFLSYYCTLLPAELKGMFGMRDETFDGLIGNLLENEVIVLDRISASAGTDEICTIENFERLLRMTRSMRRVQIDPLPLDKLQLFLAKLHGFFDNLESVEGLQTILDKLFLYPVPVNAWEEHVLPSRMKSYYPSLLDRMTADFPIIWLGTGNRKIAPVFTDDLSLAGVVTGDDDDRAIDRIFRDRKAKYGFYDLRSNTGCTVADLAPLLWDLTWKGRIGNDSFETYRKGCRTNYKTLPVNTENQPRHRTTFNRWKSTKPDSGNWFVMEHEKRAAIDPVEQDTLKIDRVRLLLKRYGILCRPLLVNELPPFSWKELIQTLRRMELSGELRAGYFFENIPGLQFISAEAFEMLQNGLPEEAIYWLNATDPASLCGIPFEGIKRDLPQRTASTVVVFHGSRKVVVARATFRKIDIFVPPDAPQLPEYLSFFNDHLSRQVNPVKRIYIEEINGEPAFNSMYRQVFERFGFTMNFHGLELWKGFQAH